MTYLCVYILIGIFIASVQDHFADDAGLFTLTVFMWPIVLGAYIVIGVVAIPYKLGNIVGEKLENFREGKK